MTSNGPLPPPEPSILSVPEFCRFVDLATRPRLSLTSEERSELAAFVRRLLAKNRPPESKKP
jgi:hypothetical protein